MNVYMGARIFAKPQVQLASGFNVLLVGPGSIVFKTIQSIHTQN